MDRRQSDERRRRDDDDSRGVDRRRIRAAAGRRIAERRSAVVPVAPPSLSWRARRAAASATFVARLERPARQLEDEAAARLVIGWQAGDEEAGEALRAGWFERAYAFAWVGLGGAASAGEAAEASLAAALRHALRIDPTLASFRSVLFAELLGAVRAMRLGSSRTPRPSRVPAAPRWLGDSELVELLRGLPRTEFEAVLLRYVGGLCDSDVMAVLDLDRVTARDVTDAGLGRLRGRQAALLRA